MSIKTVLTPMNRIAILFAFLLLSFSPANVWAEGENATQTTNSNEEVTVDEPSSDEVAQASGYTELTPEERAQQEAEAQAKARRNMIINYTFMAVGLVVVVSIAFLTSSKKKSKVSNSSLDHEGQHHPHSYQHRMDPYFKSKLHKARR